MLKVNMASITDLDIFSDGELHDLLTLTFDLYRQHCAKRKAPVFNLLRGRF